MPTTMIRPGHLSLLGVAVALAGFAAGCSRSTSPLSTGTSPPVTVHTAPVEPSPTAETLILTGTIRPYDRATVSAKVMGTVTRATLALGQAVRSGEALVTLTAPELGARVDEARVALSQATHDHEREAALAEKGVSPPESVRLLADRQSMAAAALVEADTQSGYTQIVAPFDGVVTAQLIYVGDLAMPGTPLFTIEGKTHFRVEIQVPESLATLPPGTRIQVELDPAGPTLQATLTELSPSADPVARSRLARLDLPSDFSGSSGQFVHVLWPKGASSVLTLPANALSVFGQMERVWVVSDRRAQLRLVKTAARNDGRITLLSGVAAGETVILAPSATLRDGQPVEALP